MQARARIAAEADGRGGTRLTVLHGESPLLLRRTGARGGPEATVHLVGGAAGPLRGDDLELTITVAPGAVLTIRSVAAQLALPGRGHLPPSRLRITAEVAGNATLRWFPEPMIAAAGCAHRTITRVRVEAGGTLQWRDDLVCGRHDEPSGSLRAETAISYAGTTVYRHDLHVGPDAPGWTGAAVLGEARAYGTLITLPATARESLPANPGPALTAAPRESLAANRGESPAANRSGSLARAAREGLLASSDGSRPTDPLDGADRGLPSPTANFAVLPLATVGTVATAIGRDIREVRAALDPLTEPLRVLIAA